MNPVAARAGQAVDSWLHGGDFSRESLARFRLVYASLALVLLPNFHWISQFPDSMLRPPVGPFRLVHEVPPEGVLQLLEIAFSVTMVAVLVGLYTRTASFLSVVIGIIGYGFTYSFGKVDHNVLILILPAALALAGWGDRLSLDAVRRARNGRTPAPDRAVHWPLRLMALAVGLAFLTAAVPKVQGGWLSLRTQAVQATEYRQYYTHGRDELLAGFFLDVHWTAFWEAFDWLTILLEGLLVVAVLSWRGTRVAFAVAALFHVGVYLMMNIAFINGMVYGFVVLWDRLPLPTVRVRLPDPAITAAPIAVLGSGVAWWTLISNVEPTNVWMQPVIVLSSGATAAVYLGWLLLTLGRDHVSRGTPRRSRPARPSQVTGVLR